MAASLRTKAVERSIKSNSAAYYSYVDDSKNPVLQSFEAQISDFKNYVAKQQRSSQSIDGRLSETLFQLWSAYQPRITVRMYCEKLMHLGEFLVAHEKYNIALFQCYQRYLNEFGSFHMEEFQTVDEIEEKFFPLGLSDVTADISFRALMGCALCLFYLAVEQDPKVQLDETLDRCLTTLAFIRLLMNLALKDDQWSWLVYNGTIYLYKMSRYLMALGYSVQVVEYLVWAAVSTEMCLPLLSIAYLPWRSTLYCAACEAFYDSRISPDGEKASAGENFARRALEQFKNLHELQAISIEGDRCQLENSFRYATIKIATMIFKRMAFESRRKAKGVLRPKVRQNYKELTGPWPRTLTEKLLGEMFDCRCAQFLAILQALSNSNRRLILTSPAAVEQEMEVLDVTNELFYAAQYILQVKHANVNQIIGANENATYPNITLREDVSLLDLAVGGQYVIPLSYVLQLLKYAFNYQIYDIFDSLMEPISELISRTDGSQMSLLALLQILYELEQCEKERKVALNTKNTPAGKGGKDADKRKAHSKSPSKGKESIANKKTPENTKAKLKKSKGVKNFIDAVKGSRTSTNKDGQAIDEDEQERSVEELLEDLCFLLLTDPQIQEKIEPDVLIDVSLLLWNKCRPVLRRFYNEPNENQRWLTRLDHDHIKWIHLCFQTHEIMSRFHFATVDSSAYAECSLRLGQILIALIQPSASMETTIRTSSYKQRFDQLRDYLITNSAKPLLQSYMEEFKKKQAALEALIPKDGQCGKKPIAHSATTTRSIMENDALELSRTFPLVFFAEQFLARSLKILAQSRSNLIRFDGSSMFDRNWSTKSNENDEDTDTFSQIRFLATQTFQTEKGHTSKLIDNLVKDLDAELHFVYCRVAALLEQVPDARALKKGPIDQYLNEARGNSHKKALLCAAYATTRRDENVAAEYMQKAYKHLLAAEEEDRLYFCHHQNQNSEKTSNNTVPRPCVVARGPDFAFVMAPDFGQFSNNVATYRIFCRAADRPNAKARMADTNYPGTGQQIPASFIKPVKISGLDPDLKYVFSLAIYDINGHLMGESVSESTEPILAAHPISLLFIRCLLSQVSYEIKQYVVAKKVFHSLWTYFVRTPAKIESSIRELSVENPLVIYELRYSRLAESSISLLQKFINSIFIDLEIFIKENHFYCDVITPTSSNRPNQINRIHACSQILIALELSCWLNDPSYALQSIIYLYGLLAPLIFYKIFYPSLNQVFERCISVLEEIAQQISKQRSRIVQENIQHMIACITYYMSQYLQRNNEIKLSELINQIGKKFLYSISTSQQTSQSSLPTNEVNASEQVSPTDTPGQVVLPDDVAEQLMPKSYHASVHNEELKALERFVARERTAHTLLTGNEEPNIVYTFINATPARQSYKEVQKFRKRPIYMEYLSQVLTKSLIDSAHDDFLGWYDENQTFISKRNELMLGPWRMIITRGDGVIAIAGSNENKYAAALTEFSPERKKRQQHEPAQKKTGKKKQAAMTKKMLRARPAKYHFLIPPNTPDAIRIELEQQQRPAIDKLFNLLPELYRQQQARKKFRRYINEELVWRSQYEQLNGLYCLDRIPLIVRESSERVHALLDDGRYRFDRLNPNVYTYDQSNLIIRNIIDDEVLDDQTMEQKFEFNFTQTDVKDRIEVINELLIGQISDPNIYLVQKSEEGGNTVRDRKQISPNRQSLTKKISPSISPRREVSDLYRQKTDLNLNDPYGFKRIRAYIDRFYTHYRRSIVLAYRSNNWTSLQNACKSFYDSMDQLIQYLSNTALNKIFSLNALLSHGYQAMFVASELLLDMLHRTKPFYDNNDKEKASSANKLNQWFSSLECSWAGTTFNFEQPQDRTILIDLRFVRKFILRALHALYVSAKWEKLGTIAIKFNALSDHYFADLTSPLLIAAQTALLQQLRDRQNSTDQPHFNAAIAALGRPIHPEDFYTLRPEKLFHIVDHRDGDATGQRSASTLSLNARLDPKGTDFYAQNNRALELISIPLDIEFTRKLLRQALDKTYYSSRSIIECRKMLAFYIYKQEQQLVKDFLIFTPMMENIPQQEQQSPTKRENTATLHYRPLTAGESMEFSPFVNNKIDVSPSAHITKEAVIEAYQTLSKLLLGQNRRDQYCQVLTELGDLYFHCDKHMESKTAWCDVIDTILHGHDVVTSWFKTDSLKNLLSNRTQLLQKCGIWGCLLGAIVTCQLAKYHIHINCDQHLQTCLLSSYFLRSIFFYTLPHSEHDVDYATLFLDHSIHIWPGIQLTSDEFRLNPRALMDTLAYTSDALIRHDICLHALPVIALYDVFALHCRNLQHTVQARLIRLRALIQLDLFHEVHRVIQMLFDGQKLPSAQLSGHYRANIADASSSKLKPQYFDNSKGILSDYNIGVVDALLTLKLSPAVSRLYGIHLSIEFHYLLSLFFVRLAARIPVIANLELFQTSELKQILNTTLAEARAKQPPSGVRIPSAAKFKPSVFLDNSTRSFVHVKSYLIGAAKLFAERCLNVLEQTDEKTRDYPSNLQSFEYQLLIDCLLLLSECAHQCHLDQLAARYALEILKVLSMIGEDNIHEKKVASGSAKRKSNYPRLSAVTRYPRKKLNALNILFNSRYSHNLTVYTWLKQRAYLCYIILQQINTLGKVKGTDDQIREELANVHVYIEHGLNESEQYQCQSMQATFLLYKSLCNLSELVDIKENIQRLQTASQLFQSVLVAQQNNVISVDVLHRKLLTQILLWEHQCVQDLDGTVAKLIEEKENDKLQWSILNFFVQMRERVQMTSSDHRQDWFAMPIIPVNNLYSSLLLPFVFAKLRTATIIVDYAYRSFDANPTMNDLLENAQTLFRQCLQLNQTIVEHYVNIDYECLLHLARIGRLQKRSTLTPSTSTIAPFKTIVQQLLDAIRLCYLSTNDSQFIQTCYFELAAVLLEYTRVPLVGTPRKLSVRSTPQSESNEQPTTPSAVERPSILKQRQSNVRSSLTVTNDGTRRQQQQPLKQAAVIAIRAATQMALSQKQRVQLPGLAEEFSDTNELTWPTYLAGDIIGYFVFPERRRAYKSEAEREILTLAPHFESKSLPESFDAKLDRLNTAASQDITWLHLLNYQNAVAKRLDNRQLLSFDYDAVGRSNLFFLHVFPRLVGVTETLQSLSHYSSQCIAIYPSDVYSQNVLQITSSSTDKLPHRSSVSSGHTVRSAQSTSSGMNLITDDDLANCPNINLNMMKRELPNQQPAAMFSLAWYSSNTIRISTGQIQNQRTSSAIHGFYATGKDDLVNVVSVSLDQLLNLHKKYLPIAQVAETDPKQINQNQIQSILQELFNLLTSERAAAVTKSDETSGKVAPRLTDSKAYVELECFLNAKFGAETTNIPLRDWFINTLKQSSNTLLSTQE